MFTTLKSDDYCWLGNAMNCSEFGNAHFKAQKSPVDWDYHELMKGHDVMITAPKELVQLLETLENK